MPSKRKAREEEEGGGAVKYSIKVNGYTQS
jgi:hypothetical protein